MKAQFKDHDMLCQAVADTGVELAKARRDARDATLAYEQSRAIWEQAHKHISVVAASHDKAIDALSQSTVQ